MIMRWTVVLAALVCSLQTVFSLEQLHSSALQPEVGGAKMNTNINLVGSKDALLSGQNVAVVDPTGALDEAASKLAESDIQEDPNDRFITSSSGKKRPMLMRDADEWAEEVPVAKFRKIAANSSRVLSRKKRCGGGGGDDDDGDARRTRRSRRARRARRARRTRTRRARRARKNRARASKTTATTVTRKVIQNGQVVSHTTETQGASGIVSSSQPAPVVVQQQPGATTVHTVQQPQPVVVQQQQQPAQGPAATALPSVSINGSVKVN